MDDTLANESGIPFLNSNDDIPVHSTPIKGGNVPLPSTKDVLKRMVQKTRLPQDFPHDFTASESIQSIQVSDTPTLHRDAPPQFSHRDLGQLRNHGHPSKKAFSIDRDHCHLDNFQRNTIHGRHKVHDDFDFNHIYQKDNLRPKSRDNAHLHDNGTVNSKTSDMHLLALKPTKIPAPNMYQTSSSPHDTDRSTKKHYKDVASNSENKNVPDLKQKREKDNLYLVEQVGSKDNKTNTSGDRQSLSDSNNSAYSSYANSKNSRSKQQSGHQFSADRHAGKSEHPRTPESKVRVETLTRISREYPDESINVERKRMTIGSPDLSRHQGNSSNKSSTTSKQNASFCELESSTLAKQRQEIQLLMLELKDRDRELSDMVAAHQQQLQAWEQDRHRLTTAGNKLAQYEEELQSKSSQLHHTISSMKSMKVRECELRRELQDTRSTLEELRAENQDMRGDLDLEKTKSRQQQEQLEKVSEAVGRLEAREEELATNLKLKERDIASATGQMKALSERLTQLDKRCKECQDREREALREKEDWKRKHDRSESEKKSLSDELANSRAEIFRLSEENRSARQQLALVQKEMGMQEKCKDELIESLKIKQERTDSQLRTIRELYERQMKEVAQLQQQLDTSKQVIQRQQNTFDEQQLSGSYQSRRSSGISEYSMEKSTASQKSMQSSRAKQSPMQLSRYREPDYDMQSSNHHSSGYQSQLSDNQTRTKLSPVNSRKYREPDNDMQSSNRQSSEYQSQLSDNQTTRTKLSPVSSRKYREPDNDMQSSNHQSSEYQSRLSDNQTTRTKLSPVSSRKYSELEHAMQSSNPQSLGYQSQLSEKQTTRIKQSPVQVTKHREPEYDMQSSNHHSSGYQSQLSENQTGLVVSTQQLVLHNASDHHTVTSSTITQHSRRPSDDYVKSKASSQYESKPKDVHFSLDSPRDNIKKKLEFSEFSSDDFVKDKVASQSQYSEETPIHEKAGLPKNTESETVPKTQSQKGAHLQSPPRQGGFVIQQTRIDMYPEQSDPRGSAPVPSSRETNRVVMEEQREVTHMQREATALDSSLSRQDREDCDREMERRYLFENKLRSFLEDLDEIDDSIWEDKTLNKSLNISAAEGSPVSKLQNLLLESRLMIQSLEKSAESPGKSTSQNNSSSTKQTSEKNETEVPANSGS